MLHIITLIITLKLIVESSVQSGKLSFLKHGLGMYGLGMCAQCTLLLNELERTEGPLMALTAYVTYKSLKTALTLFRLEFMPVPNPSYIQVWGMQRFFTDTCIPVLGPCAQPS